MLLGFGGLLVLVPLGYALTFGLFGLPELGAGGLGIASAIMLWAQAIAFALYLRRVAALRRPRPVRALRSAALADASATCSRIGLPIGVTVAMEGSLFVATALLIGRLGAVPVGRAPDRDQRRQPVLHDAARHRPRRPPCASATRSARGDRAACAAPRSPATRWCCARRRCRRCVLLLRQPRDRRAVHAATPRSRRWRRRCCCTPRRSSSPTASRCCRPARCADSRTRACRCCWRAFAYWGVGMPLGAGLGLGRLGLGAARHVDRPDRRADRRRRRCSARRFLRSSLRVRVVRRAIGRSDRWRDDAPRPPASMTLPRRRVLRAFPEHLHERTAPSRPHRPRLRRPVGRDQFHPPAGLQPAVLGLLLLLVLARASLGGGSAQPLLDAHDAGDRTARASWSSSTAATRLSRAFARAARRATTAAKCSCATCCARSTRRAPTSASNACCCAPTAASPRGYRRAARSRRRDRAAARRRQAGGRLRRQLSTRRSTCSPRRPTRSTWIRWAAVMLEGLGRYRQYYREGPAGQARRRRAPVPRRRVQVRGRALHPRRRVAGIEGSRPVLDERHLAALPRRHRARRASSPPAQLAARVDATAERRAGGAGRPRPARAEPEAGRRPEDAARRSRTC